MSIIVYLQIRREKEARGNISVCMLWDGQVKATHLYIIQDNQGSVHT